MLLLVWRAMTGYTSWERRRSAQASARVPRRRYSGISQDTKEDILRYQPGYQGGYTQVSLSARIPKRRNAGTSQDTHVSGRILRYQPGYQGGDTQVSLGMSQDTIGRKYV